MFVLLRHHYKSEKASHRLVENIHNISEDFNMKLKKKKPPTPRSPINQFFKWINYENRYFTKDGQIAKKHMKRCY